VWGDHYTLILALEEFAELAAGERQWALMIRLRAVVEALREEMSKPRRTPEGTDYSPFLSGAREALGEELVAAEWRAGQGMSLEQAIAFALESNGWS
jgi:hypothetical protein